MRLSNLLTILWVCVLGLEGTIHPQYSNGTECQEQCRVSRLRLGADYTRANMKVDGESAFNGNLGGVQGSYEYKPWNSFYGSLEVAWKQGKTKNSFADRQLAYVDVQERVGYTWASCCNDLSVTFFSGFGYRYLEHRLKQFEVPSIKFKYSEFYVPIGFLSEYFFCSGWSLGFNITWMPQVFPSVEIVPLKGAHWSLTNRLGNVLVELPLTYRFNECSCNFLELIPFYEHWEDGRSTAKTSGGQELGLPKNSYNFWGAQLNFVFVF